MKGASVTKVILRYFSSNDPICHSHKFQPWQTPPSHFLPISPRFLTNIRCRYFSLNIWVVYDQLELDWCIFDQNWAKSRPLHFQIFQILNATDRPIVHCFEKLWCFLNICIFEYVGMCVWCTGQCYGSPGYCPSPKHALRVQRRPCHNITWESKIVHTFLTMAAFPFSFIQTAKKCLVSLKYSSLSKIP